MAERLARWQVPLCAWHLTINPIRMCKQNVSRTVAVLFASIQFVTPAFAQERSEDSSKNGKSIQLDNYTYSFNKFRETVQNVAQPVSVYKSDDIRRISPQNTANLLEQTGEIFVQRSQLGGGSPVLRGFEASRILLVVDGVRLNNAIYRAGHLQNVLTIDNNQLDRVEVLYGPGSTLYGSDALGGVISFTTKNPKLSKVSGDAMVRYSSAYDEKTGFASFNIGGKRWASLTSVTFSDFGDLRTGSVRSPYIDSFGKRFEYLARINGVDSAIANNDPNRQVYSGYRQIDLAEKILFKQNERISHILNLQYSNTNDIPRYDRLTEYRNGKLRFAEWCYGPQMRSLASYQLKAEKLAGFFTDLQAGINYQFIEESRHQRNRGSNQRQSRIEQVDVVGYNIDLRHTGERHELSIGLDGQYNSVNSSAKQVDITNGIEKGLDTRYPDGGSSMYYGAIYGHHLWKIVPGKLVINDGLRLNYTNLRANFVDTSFFAFPFKDAKQSNLALSGNVGVIYTPVRDFRTSLSVASGFRAPNVDDVARVFESAGGVQLIVPNPELKPEKTYTADLTLSYGKESGALFEIGGFYTRFENAIVIDRFRLNDADSVFYNGSITAVSAPQNKAKAFLYGAHSRFHAKLTSSVSVSSMLTYTYGRYRTAEGSEVPLDHVPPVYGRTGVRYELPRVSLEAYAIYNGWKHLGDYNPFGEDNLQYATVKGMPGWMTLNLRAAVPITSRFVLQAALENILDQHYRQFASGISAPGRNLVITLRGKL